MNKIAFPLTLLATVLVCLLPAAPAQAAGAARTFVSAIGSDSNNCTNVATPCRHLATAFAATAPDGEIYVLDPANYGALTINHAVSIEGHGWASIAPVTNQAAITINAGPTDKINIIGVVLDGTAVAGTRGINFVAGGSLIVRDSVIRNFTLDGILFAPSAASELSVSNTLVADNGIEGIFINASGTGTVTGTVDHVATQHNGGDGLHVQSSSVQNLNFTASDSVISDNTSNGVGTGGNGSATINLMIRNTSIANNLNTGLSVNGAGTTLRVTRSAITGNGLGWFISSGGVIASYTDNNFDGNTSVNTAPPTTATYK